MVSRIVIDIETLPREIPQNLWDKKSKSLFAKYKKPETVAGHLESFKEDFVFTPGGSQVLAIGCMNIDSEDEQCFIGENEEENIRAFVLWLESHRKGGIKLIGFNLKKFDLPMIASAMARAGIGVMKPFGRYDIIDLFKEPFGYDAGMYSLDHYLWAFGCTPKTGSGDDVGVLWAEDKKDGGTRVKDYCLSDVRLTAELYRKLNLFYDI